MKRPGNLAASLLLALGSCAQHNAALAPYARATLTAGVGLGDLKLGQTTLGAVVQRFGVESVTQIASEEVGLELLYEHGQLALLFLVDPSCLASLGAAGLRPAAVEMQKFLERNPCLREVRLASLSVREGSDAQSSFFQGASDAGARLWGKDEDARKHGTPDGGGGHILAGMNPSNPRVQHSFKSGICFTMKPPENGDPALAHIQRITIFPASE